MSSTRQQKISSLLQRELADYFQKNGSRLSGGKMVSVTVVRITPDLGLARVYLSLFPGTGHEESMKNISDHSSQVRAEMGNRLKNNLKHIPEFAFYLDDSLDYIDNIENLLND